MSIRFFSGEEDARRGGQPPRESQQALLLRLLRESDGATVSYQRLRDAGVELPASVVSELELAGIPIEHRYEGGEAGQRRPGVRLNPALDPERPAPEEAAALESSERPMPATARRRTFPSGLRPTLPSGLRPRLPSGIRLKVPVVPIALIGAMIVVIAVVVVALQTSHVSPRHATRHHAPKPQTRSVVIAPAPQAPQPQLPATPVSPALATEFEAQGHDLLQSGQYGDAVPVLKRALAATGMHLSDCLEPVNETCLTYAYAMYDLGRALELNGNPTAALPVLEKRLEIDNQRDVVAAELARVRTVAQQ